MKATAIFVTGLLCASQIAASGNENKYVSVTVTLAESHLSCEGHGTIQFVLEPAEGIHLTADPAVEFTLDDDSVFHLEGDVDQHADTRTGFLSLSSPLTQTFGVRQDAASGEHLIKGTLVYYYCSDEEGWCMRYAQPVKLTATIAER